VDKRSTRKSRFTPAGTCCSCRSGGVRARCSDPWAPAPSIAAARHRDRVDSGFRELSATTPIRSPKSVPDTVFPSRRAECSDTYRALVYLSDKRRIMNALTICNGFCSAAVQSVRIAGAVSRSVARGNRCFGVPAAVTQPPWLGFVRCRNVFLRPAGWVRSGGPSQASGQRADGVLGP
jgi:hypothetical protein